MADLLTVLKTLDPADDTLWTDDGLPALDAVKSLTGDAKVTRAAINKVALGLTRDNVTTYEAPQEAVVEPEVAKEPVVEVVPEITQDELQVQLDKVRTELFAKVEAKNALESEILQLNQQYSTLEAKVKPIDDSIANAEALAGYAAAAQAEREARAEKMQKLLESGLSMKEIQEVMGLNKRRRRVQK